MRKLFLFIILLFTCGISFSYFSNIVNPFKKHAIYDLESILSTINPNILPRGGTGGGGGCPPGQYCEPISGIGGEPQYVTVLTQKASELRDYYLMTYGESTYDMTDRDLVALSFFMIPFEKRDQSQNATNGGSTPRMPASASEAFNCAISAIGTAVGIISAIRDIVSAWNSGVTTTTIFKAVKSIFKTAATWFVIAWGVYEFGDCMGWW